MLLHYIAGILSLGHVASAHVVFGDLEELKPRPLEEFCDKDVKEGYRHCKGSVSHMMEDGGIVRMNWALQADPDRILSIDTEKKHGVKIRKCTPSTMELELPESHVWHAQVGQLIVASEQSHTCEHYSTIDEVNKEENGPEDIPIHDLYHRVTKVISTQWLNADGTLAAGSAKGKKALVKLWTKELANIGEAVPTVSYNFDYIPTSVPDVHGPARKEFEREAAEKRKERKLQFEPINQPKINVEDFARPGQGDNNIDAAIRWRGDGGQPLITGQSVVTDDLKSLLNFRPKQVANFAWNWDFGANSSIHGSIRDMWYNYTLHGGRLNLKIRNPFIRSHNTISLRFRSYTPHENAQDAFFPNDNTWVQQRIHSSQNVAQVFSEWEPRVKWIFEVRGHGEVRANVLAQMISRLDTFEENPVMSFPIPILRRFWRPKCFGKFHFNIGSFPITFSPCVEFEAKFFHFGRFHGSFGMGLGAHVVYEPKLEFDSFAGLRVSLGKGLSLQDVSITPPNWLMKTKHFECGIALEPALSIKGALGANVRQTRAVVAIRPYVNMSIIRVEPNRGGSGVGYSAKELIIYPYRITGVLQPAMYMVRVETKADTTFNHEAVVDHGWERKKSTSPSPYWGEVEFRDPVRDFSFGRVAQQDLLKMVIWVTIVRVNDDGSETQVGRHQTNCRSETDGVCQPSPFQVQFGSGAGPVTVYLHGLWSDDVSSFFTSRFKSVSFFIPELIINKHHIEKAVPGFKIADWNVGQGQVQGANAEQPLIVVLTHGGKSYPLDMNRAKGYVPDYNSSSLSSDMIIELGMSFLSTWDTACPASGGISGTCDPRITVYLGHHEIASARIPAISWAGSKSAAAASWLGMLGAPVETGQQVPVSVALNGVGGDLNPSLHTNVGMVRLLFEVASSNGWNRFIFPRVYQTVVPGQQFNITFTIAGSAPTTPFRIKYFKQSTTDAFDDPKLYVDAQGNVQLVPQIGNMPFEEVKALQKDIQIKPSSSSEVDAFAIAQSRYVYYATPGAEFPVGSYMMLQVEWTDVKGFTHVMPSPPIRVVTAETQKAIARVEERERNADLKFDKQQHNKNIIENGPDIQNIYENGGRLLQEEERRLFWPFEGPQMSTPKPLNVQDPGFDNWWVDNPGGQLEECKRKELHFTYGAGLSFKAYVKHLSLPSDLPVLGGISDAPEIGTPWIYGPTYATTPEGLKDKLPRIFCRHGLCGAALPGCTELADRRNFFPEIVMKFQHTFRFADIKDDHTADALRQGLAYVFAVLPEAIHLILHYSKNSVEHNNIENGVPTPKPNSGRRRVNLHNTQLSGEVVCENRGYDVRGCSQQDCCVWHANWRKCESAVGNGPCVGGYRGQVYDTTTPPAPGQAVPYVVPGSVLPPTVPPVAAVPNVVPALGGRRLEDEDEVEEKRMDNRPIHQMTFSFEGGLRYEVDQLLIDEMIKQGMFREMMSNNLEEKFEVHSYTIRDLGPPQMDEKTEATYGTVTLFVVLGSVILGVLATIVRRSTMKNYQRIEESQGDPMLVELE
jgi:hypothetical protein